MGRSFWGANAPPTFLYFRAVFVGTKLKADKIKIDFSEWLFWFCRDSKNTESAFYGTHNRGVIDFAATLLRILLTTIHLQVAYSVSYLMTIYMLQNLKLIKKESMDLICRDLTVDSCGLL